MKSTTVRTCTLAFLALAGASLAPVAAAAEPDPYDGAWHYALTLYGWAPGVKGTFNFDLPEGLIIPQPGLGATASGSVSPDSYLSSLKFAAMVSGEARKGDGAIVADLIYADLANLKSHVKDVQGPNGSVTLPLDEDVNLGLRATILTVAGSYTVARNDSGAIDLLAGVQYAGIRSSFDWNFSGPNGVLTRSGGASESVNLWDAIIGVRGRVKLSDDGAWFLPYEADIGAGNASNWTWQAYAGVGYRFDWGDLILAFRNISYDQSGDKHLQSVSLTGPLLGVTFHW